MVHSYRAIDYASQCLLARRVHATMVCRPWRAIGQESAVLWKDIDIELPFTPDALSHFLCWLGPRRGVQPRSITFDRSTGPQLGTAYNDCLHHLRAIAAALPSQSLQKCTFRIVDSNNLKHDFAHSMKLGRVGDTRCLHITDFIEGLAQVRHWAWQGDFSYVTLLRISGGRLGRNSLLRHPQEISRATRTITIKGSACPVMVGCLRELYPCLDALSMENKVLSDLPLQPLPASLTKLELKGVSRKHTGDPEWASVLRTVWQAMQLRHLALEIKECAPFNDRWPGEVLQLTALTYLSFKGTSFSEMPVDDANPPSLLALQQLREVNFQDCDLPMLPLGVPWGLPDLHTLNIVGNRGALARLWQHSERGPLRDGWQTACLRHLEADGTHMMDSSEGLGRLLLMLRRLRSVRIYKSRWERKWSLQDGCIHSLGLLLEAIRGSASLETVEIEEGAFSGLPWGAENLMQLVTLARARPELELNWGYVRD